MKKYERGWYVDMWDLSVIHSFGEDQVLLHLGSLLAANRTAPLAHTQHMQPIEDSDMRLIN